VSAPASIDPAARAWALAAVRTSAEEEEAESAAVRGSLCSSSTAAELAQGFDPVPRGRGAAGGVGEDGAPSTSCEIFPQR